MRLDVLGCSGGELGSHRATCFLLDGVLAIDAGALTSSLSLRQLSRVDDVLLTHSHLDHVKDVPLMADLLAGRRRRPVRIHASAACTRTLRRDVLNGRVWPDFTRIPHPRRPVLALAPFDRERPFRIGRYRVQPVPVRHTVESTGFVVGDGRTAFAISGDTGPTTRFWRELGRTRNLRAVLVETSFPSSMQEVAERSGHLTPRDLAAELDKVDLGGCPVYLYHLKPAHAAEVKRDLAALRLRNVRVLKRGERIAV